jgi:DNA-binding transcriptional ArsR family regulator
MGWLQDLLKDIPVSAVLEQRVKLADDKYEAIARELEQCKQENANLKREIADLKRENERLRAQLPSSDIALSEDTVRVLVYMFDETQMDYRGVEWMADRLEMTQGVLRYHLDELKKAGFAHCTGFDVSDEYWAVQPDGRKYVMESVSQEMLRKCAIDR